MADLPFPINRYEQYLEAIAKGDPSGLPSPINREETYLSYIAHNGGGGGSKWVKLWENADPTSAMSPQDITVPSVAKYEKFIIFFAQYKNGDGAKTMAHSTFLKGYGTDLMWVLGGNGGVTIRRRDVSFTDDTTLHVGNCKAATGTTAQTNENNANIPLVLYAIS